MHKLCKLILIEDEEDIAELIRLQAEISGYEFSHSADGLNGYEAVCREKPDLIILDLMLPGQNGLDVCRKVKMNPELRHIPIIMISAKSEETDVVLGLELGADDYVTKPFSPRILLSRVKAVMRRREQEDQQEVTKQVLFGPFMIDVAKYQVKKKDKPISLTLSEFNILTRLSQQPGKALTRNQLLDALQNDDAYVVDRNIDVHVAALRKKLGPGFNYIETVRGVGYRFTEE
jgi:two-component system, OmpR family, alkaline phosphatase synthesis response regulator PhoP